MNHRYSERICSTQKSFIREILKVTADPEIISFAGGLPNPNLIDDEGIQKAAAALLKEDGKTALQYSTTEGHPPPLREWIAERYRTRYGLSVSADQILITNGSQQCLDLIGKVYLDTGDSVIVEDPPGYLGAIQSFSMFQPEFLSVPLNEEGPDLACLTNVLETSSAKFMYGIPNSQNPPPVSPTRRTGDVISRPSSVKTTCRLWRTMHMGSFSLTASQENRSVRIWKAKVF